MSEYEFEVSYEDYQIEGTIYYSIDNGEIYIDDFDYAIYDDNGNEVKELFDEVNEFVADYIQNIEIDTGYQEYDTTFEKYM